MRRRRKDVQSMHRFTDMTDLKRGVVVVRSLGVGWRAVWWAGVIGTPHTAAAIAATTALDANARSHIHCARSRTGLCVFFSSEQDEGRSSSFRRLWSIVVRGYFWGSSNDPLKLQSRVAQPTHKLRPVVYSDHGSSWQRPQP